MSSQQHASYSRPAFSVWMIFMLGTLSAFGPFSIDMYLPALPFLVTDLNTTASLAQLSLTACLLGIAIGQIFIGPLSDIWGRKKPLLAGLVVYVAASILCVTASTIELFITMRFVQGAAGSAGIVLSRAAVRDLYTGSDLTKFFSLLMLVNGAAPVIAPVFGGQVLYFTSWRGVFWILAAIGTVMTALVLASLPETLPMNRRVTGGLTATIRNFRLLLSNRKFIGYALIQGFSTGAMFCYIAGSPFVLQNIFNVSPQIFSLLFAINSVGIIIGSQATGRLAGKIAEMRLLKGGLTMGVSASVILFAAILFDGGLYAILIPLFFVISSGGIISTSSFALAMQDQEKTAGSASALIGLLSFVLGGILAPFVGIAGSSTALPMGLVIMAAELTAVCCYFTLVAPNTTK